jgi:hypothetical protein
MVNTIVMTTPPRFDFLPSLFVNNEVISFNRQLKKRMVPYNNVKILETCLKREFFTKHGLHLNSSGKECIAQRLSMVVKSFTNRVGMSPISLQWKDDTMPSDLDGDNKSYVSSCNAVITLNCNLQ